MNINNIYESYDRYKMEEEIFHHIMKFKVKSILLVSAVYDAFILEQDGFLSEQIIDDYSNFNLSNVPIIRNVHTGEEALKMMEQEHFDVVVTMMRIGEMSPFELSRKIKEKNPETPVLLLVNLHSDLANIDKTSDEMKCIDNVFLWNGDSKIFMAMTKYIEDMRNVKHDTELALVKVILLVEDSVNYYSRFLPMIYDEIMKQTLRLISEELSDKQKNVRTYARPKILLAHNYEQAMDIVNEYKEYLLCVISDVKFPKGGKEDDKAGFGLVEEIRAMLPDIPMALQSSDQSNSAMAKQLNTAFLNKNSKRLHKEIEEFVIVDLGFGDFIFRDRNGNEIGRAGSILEFETMIHDIPYESLLYHSERNHFSSWLIARGEMQVPKLIKPLKFQDFKSDKELRDYLLDIFRQVRERRNKGRMINFNVQSLSQGNEIVRLRKGSLGGKGRGIAFLNSIIVNLDLENAYDNVRITIPRTAIIGTDEFDFFMENNHLYEISAGLPDDEIKKKFVEGELSYLLSGRLRKYIDSVEYPIAVRSSSLLEDSQSQPLAGVYQTFMLPNNHSDPEIRYRQLCDAVKLVFSSVYLSPARQHLESLDFRIDEEKMAVVIQEIVGEQHDNYFYPHFSGVAESYNFYPSKRMKREDGVVALAAGLGKAVVDGESAFRFCPRHPNIDTRMSDELPANAQQELYVLDMTKNDIDLIESDDITLAKIDLKTAENHGVLDQIVSVFDYQNNRINDGLDGSGPRIITFAGILKYENIPLSDILNNILEIGEKTMGITVEIEFAVDLNKSNKYGKPVFYLLQIRPLAHSNEEIDLSDVTPEKNMVLYSRQGIGNGTIVNIEDIIYIPPDRFDNAKTAEMVMELNELNDKFRKNGRNYMLIGFGRWGSRDPHLGIPVKWEDISRAKIIVETSNETFSAENSQGSHFFHNLISLNIGYFTVPYNDNTAFVNWDRLNDMKTDEEKKFFKHVRTEAPLTVRMDGRRSIFIVE